jgi:hypothetical protein
MIPLAVEELFYFLTTTFREAPLADPRRSSAIDLCPPFFLVCAEDGGYAYSFSLPGSKGFEGINDLHA